MFESLATLPTDPVGDAWWDAPRPVPPESVIREGDLLDDLLIAHEAEQEAQSRQPIEVAELLDREPGGVLAAAVEDLTADGRVVDLGDPAVIAVAVAAQRLLGWAMGVQLRAVAELARRWEATPLGERAAIAELALACGVSEYAMAQRLDAALVLPWRLPRVWAALVAGRVDWAKAALILDQTMALSDAHTQAVEDDALAVAMSSNLPNLRAHLARVVLEVDPQGAADRARAAHAQRWVTFRPGPDCTGVMTLTASAAAVAAAETALNRLTTAASHSAGAATAPGTPGQPVSGASADPRCPEVARADVLLDLIHTADTDLDTRLDTRKDADRADPPDADPQTLNGAGPGQETVDPVPQRRPTGRRYARSQVVVTVPLSTLLTPDQAPGRLAGFGLVPAAMARELVAHLTADPATSTWRCAVTDDRPGRPRGTLLALGRPTHGPRYTPGAATRDFVDTRDATCRFPGCRQPAGTGRTDLDHRIPWRPDARGGPTCDCNLQVLCTHHHRLKHESRFTVDTDADGTLTWTTPTGRRHYQPLTTLPHGPLPRHPRPVAGPPLARDPDPPPF